MIECNKINSITMFPNGSIIKCFDNYINNNLYNYNCKMYSCNCNIDIQSITKCIFILNNNCNSNCVYCCDNFYKEYINSPLLEFDFEKVRKNLQKFKFIDKIDFGYYEPLYDVDKFIKIIRYLVNETNIKKYDIFTDGINISLDFLKELDQLGVEINIFVNINFPRSIHNKYKNKDSDNIVNKIKNINYKQFLNIELIIESVIFADNIGLENELILNLNDISKYVSGISLLYNMFDLEFYKIDYKKILLKAYSKLKINNCKIEQAISNLRIRKNVAVIKGDYYYREKLNNYKKGVIN